MRTVNKIKERDMDPSFIMSLISDAQSLDVTALLGNYLRKDDKILRTSLPTEYVNEVSEEIHNLWAAINNIEDNYRQKSVPIKMNDLDPNLQSILNGMFYFLQKVRTQEDSNPVITYNESGERVIIITDALGNEYNVVIPSIYDLEQGLNAIDKARFQGQLDILDGRVTETLNTIALLQRQINNIRTTTIKGSTIDFSNVDLNNITDQTLEQIMTAIIVQEAKITKLEEALNSQSNDESLLSTAVSDIQGDISNIYERINKKTQLTDLSTELQTSLGHISDLVRRVTLVENNKMNKPVLSEDGYLYYCANQGQLIKTRPPVIKATICNDAAEVVAAQDNLDSFIINLQTGQGYQYNWGSKVYDIIQVSNNTDYNNLLILNLATERIEYFILNGSIIKLDSLNNSGELINSAHLTVKRMNIAAGESVEITRVNNLKKFPPLVLVYDYDNDSRSVGRYINGEGVITISHNSEGFLLYNDHDHELEVMVMVGD